MDWDSAIWRPYIDAFSRDNALIRSDQRSTGLSDPNPSCLDLDRHVDELKSVIDAAGLDKIPLIALSQRVPVAVRIAAANPERVKSIVLYGGYLEGRALRDEGTSANAAEAMKTLMKEGWGETNSALKNAFTSF
jgi:pimeloyl-ACP methyl ester carboxylesterase